MYLDCFILVVGAFGVLLIHELGHLVAARYFGLKVSSLSIGLGPEIIGYTDRSGTRWKVALLPIAGSCTFSDDASALTSCLAHSPDYRAFSSASQRERATVYAAGPIFNLAFASIVSLVIICQSGKFTIVSIEQAETDLALLIGGLSASIGLFNLLPFLPLDGGRLALVAIEACRGGPVSEKDEKQLYRIGSSILCKSDSFLNPFPVQGNFPVFLYV
jgi:membrane-associated protease RseP (regulator of RpoE activity)